jgi:hypothetical protein
LRAEGGGVFAFAGAGTLPYGDSGRRVDVDLRAGEVTGVCGTGGAFDVEAGDGVAAGGTVLVLLASGRSLALTTG